ncbi:Gamma-aminobutyric acid receptor subunit beta [Araneus ventricosus]|uniref:Gamma-aminobutyric acid receptor subunit beta n=1 Tax=Araneus ventricosus TaxID=182803 RepID=A0A4Y2ACR4_ARAVE|nr:Gamma-aminobutyric acid receptor subunit beta [Araneus ventricosus]
MCFLKRKVMSDLLCLLQDIRLKKVPEAQVTVPPELEALFGKNTNKMCGVSPSDIDKYSRLLFPVCFVSFNMMYWIIYLHISDTLVEDNIVLTN